MRGGILFCPFSIDPDELVQFAKDSPSQCRFFLERWRAVGVLMDSRENVNRIKKREYLSKESFRTLNIHNLLGVNVNNRILYGETAPRLQLSSWQETSLGSPYTACVVRSGDALKTIQIVVEKCTTIIILDRYAHQKEEHLFNLSELVKILDNGGGQKINIILHGAGCKRKSNESDREFNDRLIKSHRKRLNKIRNSLSYRFDIKLNIYERSFFFKHVHDRLFGICNNDQGIDGCYLLSVGFGIEAFSSDTENQRFDVFSRLPEDNLSKVLNLLDSKSDYQEMPGWDRVYGEFESGNKLTETLTDEPGQGED